MAKKRSSSPSPLATGDESRLALALHGMSAEMRRGPDGTVYRFRRLSCLRCIHFLHLGKNADT